MLLLGSAWILPAFAQEAEQSAPKGTLTKAPELIEFVAASFPESELGNTGTVVLAITIREDGTVEDVTVSESASPAFDEAAVAAARDFVFSPAEIDGVPARIGILYRYDFVEQVVAPTTAIFSGVVEDREAKVPVPGVTVTLGDGRTAVTDDAGRFEFLDVAPGAMSITLAGDRLTSLATEETFVAGERLEANYGVFLNAEGEEGDDFEILVTAPTIRKQAVSIAIAADEARKVPGTQGDVLRVVENLPGVARASLGTGELVVWGARPEDTGIYVDGVPVPRLYHDGGLRSFMGPAFVQSVELVPGAYGAQHGRAIGGLVTVETSDFEHEGWDGSVAADIYDASAAVHGPVGERFTFGIAGRYGYVGTLLATFAEDVEDTFPLPHYADGQVRLGALLRPNERLDVTVLASHDATARTAANPDPAREASEDRSLDFQRVSLRYRHDLGNGTTVSAALFAGGDQGVRTYRFGQTETALRTDGSLVGLRASYRTRWSPWLTLEAGLDSLLNSSDVEREGSVAVPPREGDVRVFGQPPPDQISSDEFTVVGIDSAPYVEAEASVFDDHLDIVAGLRIDPFARSVSRATPQEGVSPSNGLFLHDPQVEPRLSVRVPFGASYLMAATGKYSQQPQPVDLSASFGNPTLPPATSTHAVVGGGTAPTDTLSIDATAFLTRSYDLATRNQADQPARAEALVPTGWARNYGVQGMVRLDPTHGWYAWVSYTLAFSERQDAAGLPWRPSDDDQRHALTALGGHDLPSGWGFAVRARVSTGFPRTDVVGAYLDNRRDLYQPVFGEHNAIRIPTFFQADVRVAKTWTFRTSELEASLEVQNVTNRENVEEFVYNADYTERGAIRGLPILPVLGVRWSF